MKPHYFVLILFLLIITPLQAKNIVVIGDSLSAGYGIDPQKGWVNLLADKLKDKGQFKIINLSTSGDTTSNGLAKLPHALEQYKPDILIIELGANDGLRGLAINQIKDNLTLMLEQVKKTKAKILILGTYLPPNYGPAYLNQFNNTFKTLAEHYKIAYVPMFLEGVAGNEKLMQNDGLHPNEEGQPLILKNIWPALIPLL
ncbi:arylesterase [Legionella sp. km772]|uniref:arylesterase n=1 Tax=Legionella sp. km772 TaxID=2498111 RepID=UPI000F8E79F3|nr:arylesterase [Legionella sp. km772]RUR10693.1 arylesterase [Legionella sp. km772]